jgi:hypothetical protein
MIRNITEHQRRIVIEVMRARLAERKAVTSGQAGNLFCPVETGVLIEKARRNL